MWSPFVQAKERHAPNKKTTVNPLGGEELTDGKSKGGVR